jgi:small subunit ribosomal protein S27e
MSAKKGQFVKVKCGDCSGEQTVYNRPATTVKCLVCGATLVQSTGGEGRFRAEITSVLE